MVNLRGSDLLADLLIFDILVFDIDGVADLFGSRGTLLDSNHLLLNSAVGGMSDQGSPDQGSLGSAKGGGSQARSGDNELGGKTSLHTNHSDLLHATHKHFIDLAPSI